MNRLADQTSPYLRQHAKNPVDWQPWDEAALAQARAEDKPIFLSIGYSACHWCHVMARESFSDPNLAEFLNANFVAIKVDREERPDLDEVYIEAVRLLTGTAGWPLSVFLTPELKPFYGGTYFPPEARHGLPGFRRVLESVLHFYRHERHEIEEAANRVTAELNRYPAPADARSELNDKVLHRFYQHKLLTFDPVHGGFGSAPKFPCPSELQLLLRLADRPGFDQALTMAELTLRRMANGGINDQLGGGFHRYSTDSVWLVPHFEKMLYDNALLAGLYAEAAVRLNDRQFRQTAERTLDWLEHELRLDSGGFAAALSAEDPLGEGSYYTWTPASLSAAVGPELSRLAGEFYGVSPAGNYHGSSVLHVAEPPSALAARLGLSLEDFRLQLEHARALMTAARSRRPAPPRDDKVLADWNGLALSAFATAARLFADRHRLDVARRLAGFINAELITDRGLIHIHRPGLGDIPGQLPDYAHVINGLLDLHAADPDPMHLKTATRLADLMIELFADPDGGFFTTARGTERLPVRVKNASDGAMPSGNSAAVSGLIRLSRLCDRSDYRTAAVAALRSFRSQFEELPTGFATMLDGLDRLLHPGAEIVLFLPDDSAETRRLRELAAVRSLTDTVVVLNSAQPDPESERLMPLLRGRRTIDGQPTAFVCHNNVCLAPVHSATALLSLLSGLPQRVDIV